MAGPHPSGAHGTRVASRGWEALAWDPLPWLLDEAHPNVLWRALVELVGRGVDTPAVSRARGGASACEPVAALLADLHPDGRWATVVPSWSRYDGPGWRLVAAVQLGADSTDPRIRAGAMALIEGQCGDGGFAASPRRAPDLRLTARAVQAMASLGLDDKARVQEALAWLDEAAPRSDAGGWCGPRNAECGVTAVSVLMATSTGVGPQRKALHLRARESVLRLVTSDRVGSRWTHPRLGSTDTLEMLWALVASGCRYEPRLRPALLMVQRGQDDHGRWSVRAAPPPSLRRAVGVEQGAGWGSERWLTLQAMRVLLTWGPAAALPRRFPAKPRS